MDLILAWRSVLRVTAISSAPGKRDIIVELRQATGLDHGRRTDVGFTDGLFTDLDFTSSGRSLYG